ACGNAAEGEEGEADDDVPDPVILREEDVPAVFAQIGNVARENRCVVMEAFAEEDPTHVRPPGAFARRVRVAFLVGLLMMDAMRRDPEDRTALERQRSAEGQ